MIKENNNLKNFQIHKSSSILMHTKEEIKMINIIK